MWQRIAAIFLARNREFYRDRAGLGWNIAMPFLMIFAFAFLFADEQDEVFQVGVLQAAARDGGQAASPFLATPHIRFLPQRDRETAVAKVAHHQLDLVLDLRGPPAYWVNDQSAKGVLTERLLLTAHGNAPPRRNSVRGEGLRYVDWVLPGVLAMNLMFSSLWGVGWVVVRYRKNGVLRRLRATPLSAFEFLLAQVLSRLTVVMAASLAVYLGADLILDFVMRGSYLALFLVFLVGALCLIGIGLLVAARLRTEEVADGMLNLISWPMLLMSGVWFSMDAAGPAAQTISRFLPLTHIVDAARQVMIDGAGVAQVLPEIALLGGLGVLLLGIGAFLFRWE